MERYNKIVIAARYFLLGRRFERALAAMELGMKIHCGFRKDGKTPEFMHQMQIFHYLRTLEANLLFPEDTFVAAFLHDSKEDYDHAAGMMHEFQFTPNSLQAIDLLNKNGRTMEGYFTGLQLDPVASIVKCADRAHNMSTMTGVFTREKQLRYIDEVENHFMPMIKFSRRRFAFQENAYENVKHVLNIQMDLLEVINAAE